MKRSVRYGFVLFLALTFLALPLCGVRLHAAPPQIIRTVPLAVAPGKTIDFTLHGQQLIEPRSLWTSFAARCEFVAAEDESAKKGEKLHCRVTVPRDEQVGMGVLRVVTAAGVSNPILLMVDDLRSVGETPDNHAAVKAQLLDLPLAVDGQCDAIQEDFYQFYAAAGQRLSFEVVSQRMGFKLDSVVRLLTAGGEEVIRVDDTQGSGGDSRFSHTFAEEGDYLLAVTDVRHLGGAGFHYRLRIGSFPLVTAVYPAGGRSGEVASFQLIGQAISQMTPLHVSLPPGPTSRLVSFGIESAPGAGSGWFQVEANPNQEESLEQEPNDTLETATVVSVPGVINGRLEKPGDRDHFRFRATKGQRLHCLALTRELGSPCDLYFTLLKADGSQVAQARQERETVLDFEVPEDGEYVFQVEDLLAGGSLEHVYRIKVDDRFFGFALHAELMQYVAPQGGTFLVKVLAQRRGYAGPIELAVEGLGKGVSLEGNVLEGAETVLKITLPADLAQGSMRLARIVGKAKIGEQTFAVAANQSAPLLTMFPNTLSLPTLLEETIAVGVGPPFAPFFDLAVPGNQVYFPQLVGTSTFDIEIKRTNEAFKDAVTLAVNGLPEGVTAEIAKVEDGSKAYRATLKGPPEIAEGTFPMSIVGTGKFQEQTRVVTLDNVVLRITKPLVVSLSLPGPLQVGVAQEAEIHLRRFGEEPGPVRVHVQDGPAGLLAPIFAVIPGDASVGKLQLTATAEAPVGSFDNLSVVASTTIQGQNITVQSEPVAGVIQSPPPVTNAEAEGAP